MEIKSEALEKFDFESKFTNVTVGLLCTSVVMSTKYFRICSSYSWIISFVKNEMIYSKTFIVSLIWPMLFNVWYQKPGIPFDGSPPSTGASRSIF